MFRDALMMTSGGMLVLSVHVIARHADYEWWQPALWCSGALIVWLYARTVRN